MNNNKRYFMMIVINIIIIVSSLLGVILSIAGFDLLMLKLKSLLYYTLQSNIISLFVSVLFLIFIILNNFGKIKNIPYILYLIKFVTTSGIILTLIVFWIFLAPHIPYTYFFSISNLTLHTITPILCMIEFIFLLPTVDLKFPKISSVLIEPIYYLLFVFICSFNGISFGNTKEDIVPYFFLNYEKYGWFRINNNEIGVIYWLIAILIFMCGIAYLLIYANNFVNKKRNFIKSNIDFLI